MKQYWIKYDGSYSRITTEEPSFEKDGPFNTFTEAKQLLVKYCSEAAYIWRFATRRARMLRKDDVE